MVEKEPWLSVFGLVLLRYDSFSSIGYCSLRSDRDHWMELFFLLFLQVGKNVLRNSSQSIHYRCFVVAVDPLAIGLWTCSSDTIVSVA
jgi:hypothetical protein